MSTTLIDFPGLALAAAGTTTGTTQGSTGTIKTVNTLTFAIDGIFYSKNATDNIAVAMDTSISAGTTYQTTSTVVPVSSTCLFALIIDTSGTVTMTQGPAILTADLTAGNKVLQFPQVPNNKACFGYMRVVTNASATFTPGTTAVNASGVTTTYKDCAWLPPAPLTA